MTKTLKVLLILVVAVPLLGWLLYRLFQPVCPLCANGAHCTPCISVVQRGIKYFSEAAVSLLLGFIVVEGLKEEPVKKN